MPNDNLDPKSLRILRPADIADPAAIWAGLRRFDPDAAHLERHRIITHSRRNPASGAIDLLRTRLLNTMEERGWKHLGVVSPTSGCGKTFLSGNLGFSLARQTHMRVLLCDMDLRIPGLTRVLGIKNAGSLVDAFGDPAKLERQMVRLADNFAALPNDTPSDTAAETLNSTRTRIVLQETMDRMQPDFVLYDLPPALICDDILAFKYQLDAVVLVSHAEKTTVQQIRDTETLLDGEVPILATVLNQAEDAVTASYIGG